MADGISIDLTDLYKVAAQFDDAVTEVPKGAVAAMRGAAYTAKEAWQEGLESSDVPAAASTVSYEVEAGDGEVSATVSNSRGSERLQGYAYAREYGSPTVAPSAPARAAVEPAAADLAKGLEIAGERALKRALGVS